MTVHNGTDSYAQFWPLPNAGLTVMQAFQAWFTHDGWQPAFDHTYNPARTKIALYVDDFGVPTHAARLIGNGVWTSKLGQNLDLSHGFGDLDGPKYGRVLEVYEKTP